MIENTIVKITDSSGYPVDESLESLMQLQQMGYNLDKENQKLDMQVIDNVAFSIIKFGTSIDIIAHTLGKKPDDKRANRYYYFYNTNKIGVQVNLIDVLKDFLNKAIEESDKYKIEIKETQESLFLFEQINKVVTIHEIPPLKDDLLDVACMALDQNQPLQFETRSIEKAMYLLINLESNLGCKNKNFTYTLYNQINVHGSLSNEKVSIFIKENYANDIEPARDFKRFFNNYEQNKIENEIKPSLISAINTWKNKKIYLSDEIKKSIAEDIIPIVNEFRGELEPEIRRDLKMHEGGHELWLKIVLLSMVFFGFSFIYYLSSFGFWEAISSFYSKISSSLGTNRYLIFILPVLIIMFLWSLLDKQSILGLLKKIGTFRLNLFSYLFVKVIEMLDRRWSMKIAIGLAIVVFLRFFWNYFLTFKFSGIINLVYSRIAPLINIFNIIIFFEILLVVWVFLRPFRRQK